MACLGYAKRVDRRNSDLSFQSAFDTIYDDYLRFYCDFFPELRLYIAPFSVVRTIREVIYG
jgi:hypothetical protein